MPSLQSALTQSRKRLDRREAGAVAEIDRTYRTTVRGFRSDLASVERGIARKLARGETVSPGLLFREERARSLLDQAERAVAVTTDATKAAIQRNGMAVIGEAQEDLRTQILAAIGPGPDGVVLSFATLPSEALNEITAAFSPGSPLVGILDGMAGEARDRVQDELVAGVARGDSPRTIGRSLSKILGGQRARAELIATEAVFGAHRRATSESFKTNRNLLNGWRWSAALDSRSCVLCYAKHGTIHKVDEELHSHCRCRCRQAPITKSWADLGFTDIPDPPQEPLRLRRKGVDVFNELNPDQQRRIIGVRGLAAYNAGEVDLSDFVARTRHPVWGPGLRRRSLEDATGRAQTRRGKAGGPSVPRLTDEQREEAARDAYLADVKAQNATANRAVIQARQDAIGRAKPIARTHIDNQAWTELAAPDQFRAYMDSLGVAVDGVGSVRQMKMVAEAHSRMAAVGVPMPRRVAFRKFGANENQRAVAQFVLGESNGIEYNVGHEYWKSPAKVARQQGGSGFWATTDPLQVVYHETGHYAHFVNASTTSRSGFVDVNPELFDDTPFFGAGPLSERGRMLRQVSSYASTNPTEFVAETFTGRMTGKTYLPEVMDLYRKYGGPEV